MRKRKRFKLGEEVKVVNPPEVLEDYCGLQGVLEEYISSRRMWRVRFPDGGFHVFRTSELGKVV